MRASSLRFILCSLLVVGCTRDLGDFSLPPPGEAVTGKATVTGRVVLPEGSPFTLAGQTVDLKGTAEGTATLHAQLDEAGAFGFADVARGDYRLHVSLTGFVPVQVEVDVLTGGTLALKDIALDPLDSAEKGAVVLAGKVVVQGSAASVANARVEFVLEPAKAGDLATRVALVPVGVDGLFEQLLAPGRYTLRAYHDVYGQTAPLAVELAATEKRKDVTATPLAFVVDGATITGKVTKEVELAAAEPAAGAQVQLDDAAAVPADATGAFKLDAVGPGAHLVRVTLAGQHDAVASHPVSVKPGEKLDLGTVALALDRGAVTGDVTLDDGKPADGAVVSIGNYTAVTAAGPGGKASFAIERIPVGSYTLFVSKERYAPTSRPVTVKRDAFTAAGSFTLTLTEGDFGIDDKDPDSLAGFTKSLDVYLQLKSPANAACYRVSENKADFGASSTLPCNALPAAGSEPKYTLATATEGLHDLYLQFEDTAGALGPVLHAGITLDKTAPSGLKLLVENGAAFTNKSSALTLGLSSGADASGLGNMRVNLTGAAVGGPAGPLTCADLSQLAGKVLDAPPQRYQSNFPMSLPTRPDGVVSVFAQLADNAGNPSAVVCASVVLDTAAPTGTSIAIRPSLVAVDGTLTNSPIVELALTATAEPLGGAVQVKLASSEADLANAVYQPLANAMTWFLANPSVDGTKEVWAVFRDSAGNGDPATKTRATIKLDRTPPAVSVTLPNGALTRLSTVDVNVTASDANGLQALTLSEDAAFGGATPVKPFPTGAQPFTLSTGDGPHRVYARVTDGAGNDKIVSVSLTLDTTAPTGVMRLGDGTGYARAVPLAFALDAASTDVKEVAFLGASETCATAASFVAYSAPMNVPLPGAQADGAVDVRACLKDVAGNVTAAPLVGSVILDRAAPTGTVLLPATSNSSIVTVTLAVSDTTSGPMEMEVTETSTFTNRFVPFTPVFPLQLSSGDGQKTLHAQVKDRAGNVGVLAPAQVKYDQTAPSGTIQILVGGTARTITNTRAVTLAITGSADTTEMALGDGALDCGAPPGGYVPYAASASYTLPAGDGIKSVVACLRDAAGNVASASASIELDQTAPAATMQLNGGQAFTRGQSANAVFTASSDVAEQYLAVATGTPPAVADCTALPGGASYSAFTPVTPLPQLTTDGKVYAAACLRDRAGNVSPAPLTGSFTRDATPPTGALTINDTNPAVTNGRTVKLGLAYSDATTKVVAMAFGDDAVDVATAPLEQPSSQRLWSLSAGDGAKTLKVRLYDEAGNSTDLTRGVTLDTAAPAIALTATSASGKPVVAAGEARQLKLGFSLPSSEPASTQFAFAVGTAAADCAALAFGAMQTAATYPGTNDPALQDNVSYVVTACAKDAAGNVGRATASILVDQVAPSGAFSLGNGSGFTALAAVAVNVTSSASDVTKVAFGAGISCATAAYEALAAPHQVSLTASGDTTITGCFQDAAGNTGSATKTVTLDATLPTGSVSLAGATTTTRRLEVTLNVTEQTPFQLAVTTASAQPTQFVANVYPAGQSPTVTFDLPATDGPYTVHGWARDSAGNVAELTSASVTLDTTPPGAPTLSLAGGSGFTNAPTVSLSASATSAVTVTVAEGGDCTTGTTFALPLDPLNLPNVTFATATNETKTFSGCFKDAAGNVARASASVVFDNVKPTATVVIGNGTGYSTTPTPAVTFSNAAADLAFTKAGVGISCSDPSGYAAFTGAATSVTLSGADGAKTAVVCLEDRAGNVSTVSQAVTLDTVDPAGTITLPSATSSGSVTVAVAITEATSQPVQLELSNTGSFTGNYLPGTFSGTSASVVWALPAGDGSKTVYGRVRDAAGRVGALTSGATTLDTAPPQGSVAIRDNGVTAPQFTSSATVDLVLSIPSDVAQVAYANGSITCSAPTLVWEPKPTSTPPVKLGFALDTATEGYKTVSVCFKDTAGNTAVAATGITFDRTAPSAGTMTIVGSEATNTFTKTTGVLLQLGATGATEVLIANANQSGTDCPDATVWQPFQQYVAWQFAPNTADGLAFVYVQYRDAAKNVSSCVKDSIVLDTTPPTAPRFLTTDTSTNATAFTAQLAAPVSDANFDHYQLSVTAAEGTPLCANGFQPPDKIFSQPAAACDASHCFCRTLGGPGPVSFAVGLALNAHNVVRVRAVDKAGNVSTDATVLVVEDEVAPTTPVLKSPALPLNQDNFLVNLSSAATDPLSGLRRYHGCQCAEGSATNPCSATPTQTPFCSATAARIDLFGTDGFTLPLEANRTNHLVIWAEDWAGNLGAAAEALVVEDSLPPSAPALTPFDTDLFHSDFVWASLDVPAADNLANNILRYEYFGGTAAAWTPIDVTSAASFVLPVQRDAANYFQLRAVDKAGNVGVPSAAVAVTEATTDLLCAAGFGVTPSMSGSFVAFPGPQNLAMLAVVDVNFNSLRQDINPVFGVPTTTNSTSTFYQANSAAIDGTQLAFTRLNNTKIAEVYTLDLAASGPVSPALRATGVASHVFDEVSVSRGALAFTDYDGSGNSAVNACADVPCDGTAGRPAAVVLSTNNPRKPMVDRSLSILAYQSGASGTLNVHTHDLLRNVAGVDAFAKDITPPWFGDRLFSLRDGRLLYTGPDADGALGVFSVALQIATTGASPTRSGTDTVLEALTHPAAAPTTMGNRLLYLSERSAQIAAFQRQSGATAAVSLARTSSQTRLSGTFARFASVCIDQSSASPQSMACVSDLSNEWTVTPRNAGAHQAELDGNDLVYVSSAGDLTWLRLDTRAVVTLQHPGTFNAINSLSVKGGVVAVSVTLTGGTSYRVYACRLSSCAATWAEVSDATSTEHQVQPRIDLPFVTYVRTSSGSKSQGDVMLARLDASSATSPITRVSLKQLTNTTEGTNSFPQGYFELPQVYNASNNAMVVYGRVGTTSDARVYFYDEGRTLCAPTNEDSAAGGQGPSTCRFATDDASQPAIGARYAVWLKGAAGAREVFGTRLLPGQFDKDGLFTGVPQPFSASLASDTNGGPGVQRWDRTRPRVDGDRVVWLDGRNTKSNGSFEPFLADLVTGTEIRLDRDSSGHEWDPPSISGWRVAVVNSESQPLVRIWEYAQ